MSTPSTRQQKVGDLIQHELARLLKKEVHDPRLMHVSLTGVDISPDLKHAKIFFTLLKIEDRKPVEKAFQKAAGYLRYLLAQTTELRYIPELFFVYDTSIEQGEKISSLIHEAIEADKKLHDKNDEHSSER